MGCGVGEWLVVWQCQHKTDTWWVCTYMLAPLRGTNSSANLTGCGVGEWLVVWQCQQKNWHMMSLHLHAGTNSSANLTGARWKCHVRVLNSVSIHASKYRRYIISIPRNKAAKYVVISDKFASLRVSRAVVWEKTHIQEVVSLNSSTEDGWTICT